jgi:ketosteroid isomerase-like protein
MKRRYFNRIELGIGLSPILASTAVAQLTGQNTQAPSNNGVAEMSTNDPMTTVRRYIDAFNRGDAAAMAATFAVPGSILDGMAPHVWQGPTATQDWYRDVLVEGKQHGASDYFVTLGEPLHNNITGDSAYVVVPATMTFKAQGKQVRQSGAVFTVALRKIAEGWRIAAWAWAKGTPR